MRQGRAKLNDCNQNYTQQKSCSVLHRTAHQCDNTPNYFWAMNSLILSLCTIASLKVYAPDLGLRTALITLVQFFASAAALASLVLIAVFAAFAIVY